MATRNPPELIETNLTDRQILLHILGHVEQLIDELEAFRPLLAMLRGNGRPDALSVAQGMRGLRRARRG